MSSILKTLISWLMTAKELKETRKIFSFKKFVASLWTTILGQRYPSKIRKNWFSYAKGRLKTRLIHQKGLLKLGLERNLQKSYHVKASFKELFLIRLEVGSRLSNKESARNSRMRKKLYIDLLEAKVQQLSQKVRLFIFDLTFVRTSSSLSRSFFRIKILVSSRCFMRKKKKTTMW